MRKHLGFNQFPKYDFLDGFTPYCNKGKIEEERKKELDFKPKYIMVERPTPTTELPYLTTKDIIERKNMEE